MYSGDVPAILSARKTYSFRGIELTLSPSGWLDRLRHYHRHHHPHVRSRPLVRLRDNLRRRRELLCFFLFPHSTWNISTHPGISRVLRSVSSSEILLALSTERRKYTIFMWSDEYILMPEVVEQLTWRYFGEKNNILFKRIILNKRIYMYRILNKNPLKFANFYVFLLVNAVKRHLLLIWPHEKLLLRICELYILEKRKANLRNDFAVLVARFYRANAKYRMEPYRTGGVVKEIGRKWVFEINLLPTRKIGNEGAEGEVTRREVNGERLEQFADRGV